MKAISLKIQITMLVILIVAGLVAAFSWTVVTHEKKMLMAEALTKVMLEGRNLALSSAKPLLHEDPEFELHPLVVRAQESEANVVSIVIVDRAGLIKGHVNVLSTDRTYEPAAGLRAVPNAELAQQGEEIRENEKLIEVKIPITDQGELLGFVYIQYAKAKVLEAISGINARMARIGLLALLVGSALSLLLALHINRPVQVLTRGADAIGHGRLDTRIEPGSIKELRTLARTFNGMAEKLEENRRALIEHERIARELEIAHEIQTTLLPRELPHLPNIEMDAFYNAASEVGGDYFDLVPVDEDHLMIVVGDVAGKGVPGLVVMAMVRILVRALAPNSSAPAELLRRLNVLLRKDIKSGMFVTLFWGRLNTRDGTLDFANAGHMPLMVYRAARRAVDVIPATGKPIGAFPDEIFRSGLEEQQIRLEAGDCILQYTDGLNEMRDGAGNEYGMKRVVNVCAAEAGEGARHLVAALRRGLDAFGGGAPQSDDLTILAVSMLPAAARREPVARRDVTDRISAQ